MKTSMLKLIKHDGYFITIINAPGFFQTDIAKPYCHTIKLLLLLLLIFPTTELVANVPLRVSVKFIVDINGNRPETGYFNSTEEVKAHEDAGNAILKTMQSELRIQITEIIDLPSLSIFSMYDVSKEHRDLIRLLAQASPEIWAWRTNAINVYITGGNGQAISDNPPDNNIVLFGQKCTSGTTCLLHELGHSLNLAHTQWREENCADTLEDDSSWDEKDQMANHNFEGRDYIELKDFEKDLVDMTWANVMSYHQDDNLLDQLTPCQIDRASAQASLDSGWLLAKTPLYVHPANSICSSLPAVCTGTWLFPFSDLQSALDSANLAGKAIVLEKGSYTIIQSTGINVDVDIYSRQGISKINKSGGPLLYELPLNIGDSQNPAVSDAINEAQRQATLARKALNEGKKNAAAAKVEDRAAIKKRAKTKHMQHKTNVIQHFLKAEKHATGNEKLAIQMELAQKYWYSQNYRLCLEYYTRVAEGTDQIYLRKEALMHASQCQNKIADTNRNDNHE